MATVLPARELGVTREELVRSKAIAALPDEYPRAARDFGLDDNQAALLAAARVEEPGEQVEALEGDRGTRQPLAALRPPGSPAASQLREPVGRRSVPMVEDHHTA